jgi:hypothetical protein
MRFAFAVAVSLVLLCSPSAFAQVGGKVTFQGKPPAAKEIDMSAVAECANCHADPVYDDAVLVDEKSGGLANVVVSIKADDPDALGGELPKAPAVLDQKGCLYAPRVLAMCVSQPLVVKNSDPFLHNVRGAAKTNPPFNVAMPVKDEAGRKQPPFRAAEVIQVKCDAHPWMTAWIAVFEHPFFAVTAPDGTFTLPAGLKDGEYTVEAWHELLGRQEAKLKVAGGKGEVSFVYKGK